MKFATVRPYSDPEKRPDARRFSERQTSGPDQTRWDEAWPFSRRYAQAPNSVSIFLFLKLQTVCFVLILEMRAKAEHRDGASVAIVRWIYNELIVQRNPRGQYRETIEGLHDPFAARIGQLSVADQNS
jgi:hypothetical protein